MQRALSLGLGRALAIEAPYATVSKAEVIRRGVGLGMPFELTLSCMSPRTDLGEGQGDRSPSPVHCGRCSKCRERHDAFLEAGVADPTPYADTAYIS
jgi:7-cyano-7-deazaguanine synthase